MEGAYLTLIFSMYTSKFVSEIVNFTTQIEKFQNFTTFLTLISELLDFVVVGLTINESF